uniref:Uncharacterized protein n=1 Tax=Anguilla anguilla TaxID=7936 RepID=A0A0E9T6S0_ANGAN
MLLWLIDQLCVCACLCVCVRQSMCKYKAKLPLTENMDSLHFSKWYSMC